MAVPADIQVLLDALYREIAALRTEVSALRAENETLRAENAEFRRRLDQDSSTSSKPPASDGLKKKPRTASLRGRSGKQSGGQPGHKGDTLRASDTPDRIVQHTASACQHCAAPLTPAQQTAEEKRQVFDLPERLIEVTEHRAAIYVCPCCGERTRACFPDEARAHVQYGPRFRAAAVYLNLSQLIPEDRVAETMADLFGAARFCPMSLTQWVAAKARAFVGVTAHIAELAANAPVRCLDETGFRVAGRNHWLHTIATDAVSSYRVSPKRGDLPRHLSGGVVVHDGLKGYYDIVGAAHALCNAHHLRELKALNELDGEAWAEVMRDLLREAHRAVEQARERGQTALSPEIVKEYRDRYWEMLRQGLAYHRRMPRLPRHPSKRGRTKRRPGHNLLIRLHKLMDDVLRFLVDFTVPFTNNLAEQSIRMMKVKMKISGAFRTFEAAQDFAALRSIVATARKQGWNILETLTKTPAALLKALAV